MEIQQWLGRCLLKTPATSGSVVNFVQLCEIILNTVLKFSLHLTENTVCYYYQDELLILLSVSVTAGYKVYKNEWHIVWADCRVFIVNGGGK
jgi:hypothetical protein